MKRRVLEPSRLIATLPITDMKQVEGFFELCLNGSAVKPVVVVHYKMAKRHPHYRAVHGSYKERLEALVRDGAEYLVADGAEAHNRAAAMALAHGKVSCVEIHSSRDLEQIEAMAKAGELDHFPHKREDYESPLPWAEGYTPRKIAFRLVDYNRMYWTMEKIIKEAIGGGQLPERLAEYYRAGRKAGRECGIADVLRSWLR